LHLEVPRFRLAISVIEPATKPTSD
jgi:hypothetical protein